MVRAVEPVARCGRPINVGNDLLDFAADFGRRSQSTAVIDAHRTVAEAGRLCIPITADLRRFLVAASGMVIDHDGRGGCWGGGMVGLRLIIMSELWFVLL